jgi:hypothetical protein
MITVKDIALRAMVRLARHQFRMQDAVAIGALVVVAVILAESGPSLVHLSDALALIVGGVCIGWIRRRFT